MVANERQEKLKLVERVCISRGASKLQLTVRHRGRHILDRIKSLTSCQNFLLINSPVEIAASLSLVRSANNESRRFRLLREANYSSARETCTGSVETFARA